MKGRTDMNRILLLLPVVCTTAASAQQRQWEPFFDFGDATHPHIAAVHLVHVFDGTTPKALAIPIESNLNQAPCNAPDYISDRALLWTLPAAGMPGSSGTFEAVPLCRTYMFCEGH